MNILTKPTVRFRWLWRFLSHSRQEERSGPALLAKAARSREHEDGETLHRRLDAERGVSNRFEIAIEAARFHRRFARRGDHRRIRGRRLSTDVPRPLRGLSGPLNAETEIAQIDRDDHGPIPRVNLSLKLTSLTARFDPLHAETTEARVLERLRPILRAARTRRVRQCRYGTICIQRFDVLHLQNGPVRAGVSRLVERRRRLSSIFA